MSYWDGKRVVITGGRGFFGSALKRHLEDAGATDVVALGSRDYDLMRQTEVERMFDDLAPDVLYNLAARVGGIGANMRAPADLYLSNLLIGTYVLEEARRRETGKTILTGTICSYPKYTPVPFHEDALWDGYPEETNAPYGVAKKALLVHAQANREQYGQNVVYLLPVNLYGPGDKFHPDVSHVIPALIKKCVDAADAGADKVEVWGSGKATREFLYVEDAAEAFVLAGERYEGAAPVNIGSGQEVSIKELAETIVELTGFGGTITWDPTKPDGQPRRRLDTSRALDEFGFRASTSLYDGLKATIEWYREHRDEAERATN